jgi:TonB family protein
LRLAPLALVLAASISWAQSSQPGSPPAQPPPLSKAPRLVGSIPAPYPPQALAEGREAVVVLQIDLDARGVVVSASVLQGAGPEFDLPALAAAQQFQFEPAEAGGKPVPVRITYRYRFEIQKKVVEKTVVAPAAAPTGPRPVSFRGRLLERGTRKALVGVRVFLLGTGGLARTDAGGFFEFRGVDPGSYQLTARTPAHERLTALVRVPFQGVGSGDFYLRPRPYDPFETIIRAPRVEEQVVQRTVRLEEISRIPGIQGDALKVVQNLPGVARVPFGLGGLVIRGSSPQDSLAFLDGHPIPMLFHFLGLRSVFNSDILSRIDFVPGNFSAEYGRLSGGLLDVWTRPGKRDGLHGFVDVNVFDAGFLLEGPVGEGSFTLSARRSYIDAILPLFLDSKNVELTVAPFYYDYQASLHYPLGKGHEIKILVYGSEDELKFIRPAPPGSGAADLRGEFKNDILFHRLQVGWSYRAPSGFENLFSASGGIDRLLVSIGQRADIILDTTFVSVRDEARWRLSKEVKLALGLDLQAGRERLGGKLPIIPKEGETARIIVQDPQKGDSRDNFFDPALYLSATWQVTPKLSLTPQLRWDYWSRLHRGTLDPRLSLRYELREGTALTAGAGLYHQPPFADEISPIFGNPNLGPFKAAHYSLGISHRFTQALSLDLTGFYKNLSDVVVRSEAAIVRDGKIVPELLNNNGRGEVYGVELLLRHQLYRGFFGWLGYTLMRALRSDGPDKAYRTFQFDQTHILTAIASYKLGRGWQVGFRWRYVTGFPFTPYVAGILNSDSGRYRPIPGPQLSERVPAFHQLDLRIDKEWAFERWRLSVYLDIQNVYNRENPEAVRYNFDFTQRAYLTGLPIIPGFGIRGDF